MLPSRLSSNSEKYKKFESLDGFRGSLALSVLVHHAMLWLNKYDIYPFFVTLGNYYGVIGFFILSSFLLTYRLLIDLNRSNNSLKQITNIICKFFIKRIFRIYIPYFIFCSLIEFVSKRFHGTKPVNSWFEMITLTGMRESHLWTISPEIKYYLFIPIFVLVTYKICKIDEKLKIMYMFFICFACYTIHYENLFVMIRKHLDLDKTNFEIFFLGSIIAVFYHDLEQHTTYSDYLANNFYFQNIIGFFTMLMFIKQLKYSSRSYNTNLDAHSVEYDCKFNAGVYMFIVLTLMVIGNLNFFTNIFTCNFLTMFGKYSFGIYLLHPMCIKEVKEYYDGYFDEEKLVYCILASYFAGFLFFYLIEDPAMKIAQKICNNLNSLL